MVLVADQDIITEVVVEIRLSSRVLETVATDVKGTITLPEVGPGIDSVMVDEYFAG